MKMRWVMLLLYLIDADFYPIKPGYSRHIVSFLHPLYHVGVIIKRTYMVLQGLSQQVGLLRVRGILKQVQSSGVQGNNGSGNIPAKVGGHTPE